MMPTPIISDPELISGRTRAQKRRQMKEDKKRKNRRRWKK
jgi:hypothetical protein